jgi:hypothetical protein
MASSLSVDKVRQQVRPEISTRFRGHVALGGFGKVHGSLLVLLSYISAAAAASPEPAFNGAAGSGLPSESLQVTATPGPFKGSWSGRAGPRLAVAAWRFRPGAASGGLMARGVAAPGQPACPADGPFGGVTVAHAGRTRQPTEARGRSH